MNESDALIAWFCEIDDVCRQFLPEWHRRQLIAGECRRQRALPAFGQRDHDSSGALSPLP